MMRAALIVGLWIGAACGAAAQVLPAPALFATVATLAVSASSTPGGVALPTATTTFPAAELQNLGAFPIFATLGNSSVVATLGGIPILPGGCRFVLAGQSPQNGVAATNVAAITLAGNSTLAVVQSTGDKSSCSGSGASGTGAQAIGPAETPFAATTTDQPLTLTLPGKVRLQNPQFVVGTSTPNGTPLQVNYAGGNACTTPTATLGAGQIDDWLYITTTTQPHVCLPTGAAPLTILGQQ